MSLSPSSSHDAAPARPLAGAGAASVATLLGQVLFLVAVAIGFLALGAVIGRDLSDGTAVACSIAGFFMLLVQSLGGARFRTGPFALAWLFAVGLVIGLGLGPVLSAYASADPAAITQAAGATALVVAVMGAAGFALDRDLSGWLRPLSYAVFGLLVVALVAVLLGTGGSPLLSLGIAVVSAALILVDFNLLRQGATEDDVVLLATGIFVSIVNLFLSFLNLFGEE
jgi:FtsH-binding integral membrane protein